MLAIVLWKIGFEFANLRAAFASKEQPTVWYFGYGANLDPQILRDRFIIPRRAQEFELKDFELTFSQPGPWKGMGFGSVESAPGKSVYGKLYELRSIDAKRMDYYEAVPFLKRYMRVWSKADDIRFYFYQSRFPRTGLRPSKRYLGLIVNNLKISSHVPAAYLQELEQISTVDELEICRDLELSLKTYPWMPSVFREIVRSVDRRILWIYVNIFRRYSLTERLLRYRLNRN